jgi:hypothetical protein
MRLLRLAPTAEQLVDGEELHLREDVFVLLRDSEITRAIEILRRNLLALSFPNSFNARNASFSQAISTSPTLRSTNVTVEPRAPVSSTGTLAKTCFTKASAFCGVPPGFFSA